MASPRQVVKEEPAEASRLRLLVPTPELRNLMDGIPARYRKQAETLLMAAHQKDYTLAQKTDLLRFVSLAAGKEFTDDSSMEKAMKSVSLLMDANGLNPGIFRSLALLDRGGENGDPLVLSLWFAARLVSIDASNQQKFTPRFIARLGETVEALYEWQAKYGFSKDIRIDNLLVSLLLHHSQDADAVFETVKLACAKAIPEPVMVSMLEACVARGLPVLKRYGQALRSDDPANVVKALDILLSKDGFDIARFDDNTFGVFCRNVAMLGKKPEYQYPLNIYLKTIANPQIDLNTIPSDFAAKLYSLTEELQISIARINVTYYKDIVERCMSLLADMFSSPRFKPEMLDSLIYFAGKCGKRYDVAVYAFSALARNPRTKFDQPNIALLERLPRIVKIIETNDPKNAEASISDLIDALLVPGADLRFLKSLEIVLPYAKDNTLQFISLLSTLLNNPGTDANDISARGLTQLLDKTAYYIRTAGGWQNYQSLLKDMNNGRSIPGTQAVGIISIEILASLMGNPNFHLSDLDNDMAERIRKFSYNVVFHAPVEAIACIKYSIENPAFHPKDLDEAYVDRFSKAFKALRSIDPSFPPAMNATISRAFTFSPTLLNHLEEILKFCPRAKALLGEGGGAEATLNLAYGIYVLGEGKATELSRKNGVSHFLRYTPDTLRHASDYLDPEKNKGKPVLLFVGAKSDYNGSLYREGQQLEQLSGGYRLLLTESATDFGFANQVRSASRAYGKIDTLLISAHGLADRMALGAEKIKEDSSLFLDLTDGSLLSGLSSSFVEKPTVILDSCSTGHAVGGIGWLLSTYWNARLFAPSFPSSHITLNLSPEGRLNSAVFDVETREFAGGPISISK